MTKKILGREPAVFFALVAGILLAVIKFVPFTPEVSGALNAVVLAGAGFATAATVSAERALPALVGLVQAVFAVFLAYGSPVPESTQTGILALIAAVAAFFVRQNVEAPRDIDGATRDEQRAAAFQNGYQAGQDDMVHQDNEALALTGDGSGTRLPDARETGAHGHTEVMPAVGEIYEPDDTPRTRFDDGGERNPQR